MGSPARRLSTNALSSDPSWGMVGVSQCVTSQARFLAGTFFLTRWRKSASASSRARSGCGPLASEYSASAISARIFGRSSCLGCIGLQLFRLVVRDESIDDGLQAAFHHQVKLVQGQADAVIGEAILRKVVSANLLAAVARTHLLLALLGQFGILFFHLHFIETGTEDAHALVAVLDLRFFVLATYNRVSGQMSYAHGGVSRVYRLTSRSG